MIDGNSVYDKVIKSITELKKQKCNFGLSITISEEIIKQALEKNSANSWMCDLDD